MVVSSNYPCCNFEGEKQHGHIYIYLFIYIYTATAYIIIYLHIDFHVTVLDIPNAPSKKTLGLTAGHVEIFPTGPSLRIKGWSWGSLPAYHNNAEKRNKVI